MVTKRDVFDSFEDVRDYPVGTIVRAMQWGDVAVKCHQRKWLGKSAPSGDQILNAPDEMFEEVIWWEFVGIGTEFIDCDGPFMVVFNPEEEE